MIKRLGRLGIAVSTASVFAVAIVAAGPAMPSAAAHSAQAAAAPAAPSPFQSPADVARGKALFTGTCGAYCHRPSGPTAGEAKSDAPSLFDCDWLHGGSDAQIFHTISAGVEGTRMVAFGGALPDEEIWRIIAYLRSSSQCATSSPH